MDGFVFGGDLPEDDDLVVSAVGEGQQFDRARVDAVHGQVGEGGLFFL